MDVSLVEIQRYLKICIVFKRGSEVIQRNTDIVQAANTSMCGYLCLFVLKSLNGEKFQSILNHMRHYGYNTLHLQLDSKDNPLPGNEPYNAVGAISMRHDICYRDNDTPAGKRDCDRKMLDELNALVPEG